MVRAVVYSCDATVDVAGAFLSLSAGLLLKALVKVDWMTLWQEVKLLFHHNVSNVWMRHLCEEEQLPMLWSAGHSHSVSSCHSSCLNSLVINWYLSFYCGTNVKNPQPVILEVSTRDGHIVLFGRSAFLHELWSRGSGKFWLHTQPQSLDHNLMRATFHRLKTKQKIGRPANKDELKESPGTKLLLFAV